MPDYYDHLGIEPDSGYEEAKSAYFNKSRQAFEQSDKEQGLYNFFLVHQAWVFVVGKYTGLFYSHKKEDYAQLKISEISDWENKFPQRGDEVYEDAKTFYAADWSTFCNTEFSRDTKALAPAPKVNYAPFILINFGLPTVLFLLLGWNGLFYAMPVLYLTMPRWKRTFRYMFFMPLSMTLQSLAYLINQNFFWTFVFVLVNLFLFLFSTSYTFLPFDTLMLLFGFAALLGFVIGLLKIKAIRAYTGSVLSLGLLPFLINAFFALNLYFSTPLTVETHKLELYKKSINRYGAMDTSPLVNLEDGAYQDFTHIRHFPFREIIEEKHTIRMNIHEGLFGIRVLKSWTLE